MQTYPLVSLGASKAREGVAPVRGSDQPGLSKVVFLLQVPDLGLVWPVHDSNGNGKDGIALPGCQSVI